LAEDEELSGLAEEAAAARENAETIAKEAKHSADLAKLMAERAASYAKEREAENRIAALAGKRDTVPKGSLDLFPELRLSDSECIDKIRKGVLDGCLSELLELALAHPRPESRPGESRDRGGVCEALRNRGAKEPVKS
jgi:hypothetical protein